ncbi:hypothetical protein ALP39_200437 [Pseudomonas marginalis pv. marginalis]|nr:hypothetical protein ALP39_200437 [Pseudomonas marginalis pv. marginalis]
MNELSYCALCQLEKALIDSHLIPAAAYFHLRNNTNFGIQQSVRINKYDGSAVQTDKQIQQPLLCKDCEDLFSKRGERLLGLLWSAGGKFPLYDILKDSLPLVSQPKIKMYDSTVVNEELLNGLLYFAISIFWRAEVWDWQWDKDPYGNGLGPRYEQEFREFLTSKSSLKNVFLSIDLNSNELTRGVFSFPSCDRVEGSWYHSFYILGIRFIMVVGGGKSRIRKLCEDVGSDIIFTISDFAETASFSEVLNSARSDSGILRRGKLSKLDLINLVKK